MVSFPFIKRASILTMRKKRLRDEDMTNIFLFENLQKRRNFHMPEYNTSNHTLFTDAFCSPEVIHVPSNILGYHLVWPFLFVAVSVCGRFGLWPCRFVAVSVCGHSGLWPLRMWPFRFVAVMTCYHTHKPAARHWAAGLSVGRWCVAGLGCVVDQPWYCGVVCEYPIGITFENNVLSHLKNAANKLSYSTHKFIYISHMTSQLRGTFNCCYPIIGHCQIGLQNGAVLYVREKVNDQSAFYSKTLCYNQWIVPWFQWLRHIGRNRLITWYIRRKVLLNAAPHHLVRMGTTRQ